MKPSFITRLCGVAALALALAGTAFGQGLTTSAVSGFVTDKQGVPAAGATITVVHEPSGTRSTTTSRANGQFQFSGLRVGGPYTISATGPQGTQPDTRKDVYLELGQTLDLSLKLSSEVVQMEAFRIQGERDTTFDAARMGAGTSFTDEEIVNIASIRSDVQDIARLDSRLTLSSLDQGGQLSAQGQNFRFNSFLIDGVESNDPFGLNSSGVSSLRSPLPLEAIEALNIELNPYDVRRAGFTGALINAVTKSGTNRFAGSIYYEFSDKDWRGKNPRNGVKEFFEERRYGVTVSGPILRDRLFFTFSYDDFERKSAPPVAGFVLNAASLALVDQVIARAKALGYDPGTLGSVSSSVATQKTYLGKLDWNISEAHRVSVTYRQNEGSIPIFAGVTSNTGTSLSNGWYDQPRNTESYTGQLFSQWTPDFRTEASYSYSTYAASPKNRGAPFPLIGIGGLTGTRTDTNATATGFLNFGTENSRQLNMLNTEERLFKLNAEYSLGNHTLVLGGERVEDKFDNRFLQNFYGNYTFNNTPASTPPRTGVENFIAGLPTSYQNAQPFPGRAISDVFAKWTYEGYAALIQDTWRPNSRLTVVGGLRLDYPTVTNAPPFNPAFSTAFGVRNDSTNDGNYTVAPRVGFNYALEASRKTELRGGLGLFQGRTPTVWLGNAYQNAGTAGTVSVNVNGNNQPALQFQPDVTRQPVPPGTPPTPSINLTDPNFKSPALWKGNLALDHQLPFGNWVASVELTATKVQEGLFIEFLNFQTATTGPGTMPDGRIRYAGNITPDFNTSATPNVATAPYNPATTTFPQTNVTGRRRIASFADVYRITNSNKGHSEELTLSLNRPFRNKWSAGIAWTHGKATEVSPMTSSTAGSLFTTRAIFNPNENVDSTSNTETRDKIVARYTRQFDFFKRDNTRTTMSLVYEGRTGRTYSWVFRGDANGDGNSGNDLFYVPSGPSDPKVRWNDAGERDAFFRFASQTGLGQYGGGVAPRNSENAPWTQTVDLTLTQQLPIFKRVRAELYLQMINFANLFNDSWGIVEEVPFTYRRRVAGATFDPAGNGGQGQYVYVFNSNTLDGVPVVADETSTSRWQAKLGVRIRF